MDDVGKASQRWEGVITGKLPDFPSSQLQASTEVCTSFPTIIDDVYICGRDMIENSSVGGILASAGPQFTRPSGVVNPLNGQEIRITVAGQMDFDPADIPGLQASGAFSNVVLHEMGHVFGIGTLWERNGLRADGSREYASGTKAADEWRAIGCSGPLPVDAAGGHWDEKCLATELMTPKSANGQETLSRITIGSLEDLGYKVDYNQADIFTIADLRDCDSSCPAKGTRRLSTGERRAQAELDSKAMDVILNYAAVKLAKFHSADILHGETEDGLEVNLELYVLYEDEDGSWFDVNVKWEDVEDLVI
jgi:hypothetical protein